MNDTDTGFLTLDGWSRLVLKPAVEALRLRRAALSPEQRARLERDEAFSERLDNACTYDEFFSAISDHVAEITGAK